mmetsp:Transcript_39219/g.76114  ORF Transcript_39219/g.76114 Transcript_39219/m.76114 type:complete len:110 (+) Transcript_39219:113-442(+)
MPLSPSSFLKAVRKWFIDGRQSVVDSSFPVTMNLWHCRGRLSQLSFQIIPPDIKLTYSECALRGPKIRTQKRDIVVVLLRCCYRSLAMRRLDAGDKMRLDRSVQAIRQE